MLRDKESKRGRKRGNIAREIGRTDGIINRNIEETLGGFEAIGQRTTLITIVISLIEVVIAVMLAIVITRGITIPVSRAVQFAERMAEGDLSEHLNIDQKDEIGELARSLNKMTFILRDMTRQHR